MTSTPALDWLDAEFAGHSLIDVRDTGEPGPAVIKPMIQLRSVMDGGTPMTVTSSDYADPERWWL